MVSRNTTPAMTAAAFYYIGADTIAYIATTTSPTICGNIEDVKVTGSFLVSSQSGLTLTCHHLA
jgi:hypothetical protein